MKIFFFRKHNLLNYWAKILIMNVLSVTLVCFAQNPSDSYNNKESIIFYKARLEMNGQQTTLADTMLVRGVFVLEPIKSYETQGQTNVASGKTETVSEKRTLEAYYLTDLDKRVGMIFKVKDEPNDKNIKTYAIENKNAGYGLTPEPFFLKRGIQLRTLIKSKIRC
ncbi:hypothetical protein DU508_07185 [Pedobacter chinensis]|uniref:Uncharacterized protein n=1 Tax=Pedobacter chinensis TaxID=2282421 RepID=A0A369PWU5_9SPHI|nr:hypothetical protein [Pedobacter chinensis]RDC56974.1 hypothetical protein DU508_07185 [Pedobacter chinensis]